MKRDYSNYVKLGFGETLNGEHGRSAGDCHNYGSMSGCDEGCPQLNREECEIYPSVSDYTLKENNHNYKNGK